MKSVQQPMNRVRRSMDSSAVKKKSLQEAARYLDTQIELHENAISDIVAKAVEEVTRTNKQQNNIEVSYGLSVLAASVFYVENVVYGKPLGNYTHSDWGTVVSNMGYFWGYGAPYLVSGQLKSPVPNCGVKELHSAMNSIYMQHLAQIYSGIGHIDSLDQEKQPAIVRQALLERQRLVKSRLACLESRKEVTTGLERIKLAWLARLEVTQSIIDI